MAQPPPRPAAARAGGPASPGGTPSSSSGPRAKETKEGPGTFFLGRYRVVDEIGVGGMASVHLARMDGPGGFQKWVAIKRIHPHLVEDDQFVDMFLDEARIAAGINHANVAQVFDLGKDDNTYWIAMEYLHGEPLREVMRRAEERRMRISPELAARISSDAAEGLHAAHELRGKNGQLLGLVHRDVTPHNLFLTYDGYTKVVDFGIAKVADRLSSTRAGTLKGKLAYMSPEQVRGAEVDRTTDIFALGVVLWEITTNQRLFRMDTDLDTLEKVQACIVPPPSTIVPGYPMELEQVVMKALAKRKQDRFQTAREFSRALQSYLMRSGAFVGPEEVSSFVRNVFADRIQKREAHLAWAAEVTSTINAAALRAGRPQLPGQGDEPSAVDEEPPRRGQSQSQASVPKMPPASGARPVSPQGPPPAAMNAQSLMDDDEDVPTTVAMREQLADAVAAATAGRRPLPAAGLPAPAPAAGGPGFAQNAGYQGQQGYGQNQPQQGYGQNQPPYNRAATQPFQQPPPQQGPEDLGQTMALPSGMESPLRSPAFGAQFGPPPGPPPPGSQGPGGPQGFNAPQGQPGYPQQGQQGFGQFPPQQPPPNRPVNGPQYGQPQANPAMTPIGMVGGVPMNLSIPSGPPAQGQGQGPQGPQSQIETALSLPRPDPAALWLAQQDKQKGERRNTGVLIAVVALTALCVIGIGALVFFKLRAQGASGGAVPSASASASAAPAASASAAAAPPATATASAAAPASASPANSAAAAPSGSAAAEPVAGKDEGYLSITCVPGCDDISEGGTSLGTSSVERAIVKAGQHKLTLKKGKGSKTVTMMIVAGKVTAQRVPMK